MMILYRETIKTKQNPNYLYVLCPTCKFFMGSTKVFHNDANTTLITKIALKNIFWTFFENYFLTVWSFPSILEPSLAQARHPKVTKDRFT